MQVTKSQLSKIHVLLSQMRLTDQKREMIHRFSSGRTESSKELTMQEASMLLQALSRHDPCDPMRRKVFALAYEAGIIWGDTPADKKMNSINLDRFLLHNGTVKKELRRMNHADLIKTVNQMQQIVKHTEERKAAKKTNSLLNELGIHSSFKAAAKHR
mgnify:FL=1